jgi:hypothetical protein
MPLLAVLHHSSTLYKEHLASELSLSDPPKAGSSKVVPEVMVLKAE